MLVSGTPEDGPNNIFYGDFFGPNESYTVLFDKPGVYPYYDPAWSHIKGQITVEEANFPSQQGSTENNSNVEAPDNTFVQSPAQTEVIEPNGSEVQAPNEDHSRSPLRHCHQIHHILTLKLISS